MPHVLPVDELHKAVYERLTSDLKGHAAVYDEVPDEAQAPYVVLAGQKHRGADTKTTVGWDASFEVEVWSTYAGTKELGTILNLVCASMAREQAYEVEGLVALHMGFEAVEVIRARQGDVKGRLGVVRQRLKIVPSG